MPRTDGIEMTESQPNNIEDGAQRRIPRALIFVGLIFILWGFSAIYGQIKGLAAGGPINRLDVACVFVGQGLLRGKRFWLIFAKMFLILGVLACGLALVWLPFGFRRIAEATAETAPLWLAIGRILVWAVGGLCVLLWSYRVLVRADVGEYLMK